MKSLCALLQLPYVQQGKTIFRFFPFVWLLQEKNDKLKNLSSSSHFDFFPGKMVAEMLSSVPYNLLLTGTTYLVPCPFYCKLGVVFYVFVISFQPFINRLEIPFHDSIYNQSSLYGFFRNLSV